MYERGSASTTRGAGGGPSRPSTTSARALCLENRPPTRSASRSRTRKPTLCRFPRYAGPGFPSPTTRNGSIYYSSAGAGSPSVAAGASSACSVRSSRSMPASASASASSASSCSAVGAARIATTTWSGSPISVVPSGSATAPAWTLSPIWKPSMETSKWSGMLVASASTVSVTSCWSTRPSRSASPVSVTRTSTVTFSPRRTSSRSTCS